MCRFLALALILLFSSAGCAISGALVKVTCTHQDFERFKCFAYPKFVGKK